MRTKVRKITIDSPVTEEKLQKINDEADTDCIVVPGRQTVHYQTKIRYAKHSEFLHRVLYAKAHKISWATMKKKGKEKPLIGRSCKTFNCVNYKHCVRTKRPERQQKTSRENLNFQRLTDDDREYIGRRMYQFEGNKAGLTRILAEHYKVRTQHITGLGRAYAKNHS